MKIEAITTFLDGPDRFEKGDIRTVDDARGAGFVAAGWARDTAGQIATGAAAAGPVALGIHKAVIGTGDSNG